MLDNTGQDIDRGHLAGWRSGRTVESDGEPDQILQHEERGSRNTHSGTRSSPGGPNIKQEISRHYWLVPIDRDLIR